jgi:hypothetical protein
MSELMRNESHDDRDKNVCQVYRPYFIFQNFFDSNIPRMNTFASHERGFFFSALLWLEDTREKRKEGEEERNKKYKGNIG